MVMHVTDIDPFLALVTDFGLKSQIVPCGVKRGDKNMAMHVADADPLKALVSDNDLFSQVVACGAKQGRQTVGFCQALFAKSMDAGEHTISVCDSLVASGSAFANSHELFLGHWQPEESSFIDWFDSAASPLKARTGCVPVLITGLSATDSQATTIFASHHQLGEPVLVRMLLGDVVEAAKMLNALVSEVAMSKLLPNWWPLLQASSQTKLEQWRQLASLVGNNWQYVCVAVDPFVAPTVREFLLWQTVVVQIPLGELEGIGSVVQIPPAMLSSVPDGAHYDLPEYLASLPGDRKDIVIILGPSRPEWSRDYNIKRIVAIKELLGGYGVVI